MAVFLLDTTVIVDAINGKRKAETSFLTRYSLAPSLGCCSLRPVYAGCATSQVVKSSSRTSNSQE